MKYQMEANKSTLKCRNYAKMFEFSNGTFGNINQKYLELEQTFRADK